MVSEELPGWARGLLGGDGAERVEAAIAEAESRTSGEIVPILVRRSSTVGHVPLLGFTLLLLCVYLADLPVRLAALGGPGWVWLVACWAAAGAAAVALARVDAVCRMLTPRMDQSQQVDLRAQIEFYELGVSETRERTGILLFVSRMEHRATVLADHSIAEKLPDDTWQELVDTMIRGVKDGDLAAGLCRAIERCGDLLAPHFPIAHDDRNELRDHLVVKD